MEGLRPGNRGDFSAIAASAREISATRRTMYSPRTEMRSIVPALPVLEQRFEQSGQHGGRKSAVRH